MSIADIAFRALATVWLICVAMVATQYPTPGLSRQTRIIISLSMAALIAVRVWSA